MKLIHNDHVHAPTHIDLDGSTREEAIRIVVGYIMAGEPKLNPAEVAEQLDNTGRFEGTDSYQLTED